MRTSTVLQQAAFLFLSGVFELVVLDVSARGPAAVPKQHGSCEVETAAGI